MYSTKYQHNDSDDYVTELVTTDAQTAEIDGHLPYRVLSLSANNGQVANDGTDTETVTVKVVDGLEVARGIDPANATVLDYDGDVTLTVDGQKTTKTVTNGSVEFDLTTDKPAGSEIDVVAESLADHPAESDSEMIEVVSA
jgi:hypothetical protein